MGAVPSTVQADSPRPAAGKTAEPSHAKGNTGPSPITKTKALIKGKESLATKSPKKAKSAPKPGPTAKETKHKGDGKTDSKSEGKTDSKSEGKGDSKNEGKAEASEDASTSQAPASFEPEAPEPASSSPDMGNTNVYIEVPSPQSPYM